MSRRLRLLFTALAMAALLWLLFAAAERALALAQRFLDLPTWLQWTLGGVL
ncbi:GTP-binding protein HSR1, partial [Rhodanobacter denitrificans]|nr:GTP-binding protein HSR1 [Rhodanobacter denitrificans]